MFWKRMTAAAGFWSLRTGTVAALGTYLLYLAGVLPFVMSVRGRPKPDDELRGLVYGTGGVDLKGDVLAGDAAWYRSPLLLGGIAPALSIALYIPVW